MKDETRYAVGERVEGLESADATAEKIEELEGESPTRKLGGIASLIVTAIAAGLSVYALYATRATIPAQTYRVTFLMAALALTFLLYPARRGGKPRIGISDIALAVAAVVVLWYPLIDLDAFVRRSTRLTDTDVWMGTICIVLILEATRRTIGWILPVVALIMIAYGHWGSELPGQWAHKGYDLDRMVGVLYISLEGIFGTPLDVAATYIILFTIYGAVLEFSGAGKFFLDFAFAATGRRASGAGQTTTIAGFLLGTVSGSGVATTVTLGSVAWPMLRKAGYDRETGGAVLSAAGIGAILSPPTLGAAAFLIAEYLEISYLDVLKMATIPTIFYYLSIFLMIELDARKMGTKSVSVEAPPLLELSRRYWYHFTSLIAIIVLMAIGFTPMTAVFYAIVLGYALSFLRRDTRIGPRRTIQTLRAGAVGTLSVASTCATAGIIVGMLLLTGLGQKMSDIILDLANHNLIPTILLTALAVWILGLAVPVTASYIIAASVLVPALTDLGVPGAAAHMFIFYYAVLSEVSPPTALAPFAASAITGGNPFKTMMMTWKYTLPAFIVPFMFTFNKESGVNLLAQGEAIDIVMATITGCLAIFALVAAVGGWMLRPCTWLERGLLLIAAGFLFYTGTRQDLIGLALLVAAVAMHWMRGRSTSGEVPTASAAS